MQIIVKLRDGRLKQVGLNGVVVLEGLISNNQSINYQFTVKNA